MKKKIFYGIPIALALCSCGQVGKNGKSMWKEEGFNAIDYAEVDSIYIDEYGFRVGVVLPKWPTYDPYTDRWEGPGADRINRVWCGRIALDTIAPIEERKWKWTISEEEKRKMTKEDIRLGDSLINHFNNL